MNQPDNPEVIQGRLGWESGDVSEATPDELEPHPKNREIYGDTDDVEDLDGTFKQSIEEKGVLEPLVITDGKEIVSGHRRWLAAKEAGLDSVPVRYSEFDSEIAEREALIEFNRQREKTPGQIVNEFEEILEIEKKRAKERQSEYHGNQHDRTSGNISKSADDGIARDKAAEKVNADVSGRTLEKGKEVKDKAKGGDEKAQKAWEGLKSGDESFSSAYDTIQDDKDGSDIEPFTSQETDEWSSPRELVEPITDALDGFDLDPCSGAEQSPFADDTFTENDDGLAQDWFGDVWVNPPYSAVSDWVEKATDEIENGRADRVVFLCKGDSSTNWWQHAARECECILAIDRRLSFGKGENSAPFASHVFVFGKPDGLLDVFNEHGVVLSVKCSN